MVPYLNATNIPHELDSFRSHSHKPLRIHINGVLEGVERHTMFSVARVAALFHDLGKLNPNFQPKLDGKQTTEYNNHSYLSVLAFLAYCTQNPNLSELGLKSSSDVVAVIALIAHHHGHLPHLRDILSKSESERLFNFIGQRPHVPASKYLAQWLPHQAFDVCDTILADRWNHLNNKAGDIVEAVDNHLAFWLDTQFGFAALIESDKRDAGDNKSFRRDAQLGWATANFSSPLNTTFKGLKAENDLNRVRNEIREEAVLALREKLAGGKRIFSLTAPTGAGKTFTLLALANEIRNDRDHLSVVYGLPFLSITEQVEGICRDIWKENEDFVSRIDSRAQNARLDELIQQAENDPLIVSELVKEHFSSDTFDGAFIITTFVQIFETLLSNRNSTLLKLPNLTKTIFLLDEVQALPPRLYIFFAAYLSAWCEKFDCYAILSTATMPLLEMVSSLPEHHRHHPRRLFASYCSPDELLDYRKFYGKKVFNRYQISSQGQWTAYDLANSVEKEEQSCLVILNTIADTKELYHELTENRDLPDVKVVLLNTHFTLEDRREKIENCKDYLSRHQRVILISTQLIEAGVDVDFPVVYRDLCPLPNLIQSAGRCNRNGKLMRDNKTVLGDVKFFSLVDTNGKPRAHRVYKHPSDLALLEQTCAVLAKPHKESELLEVQREFFKRMAHNFAIGDHPLWRDRERIPNSNLIEYMTDFNFPVVGSFRLIDKEFGEEFRLYVPSDSENEEWNGLSVIITEIAQAHTTRASASTMRILNIKLDGQLRNMSDRIVTIRGKADILPPLVQKRGEPWELCGLYCLELPDVDYSFDTGILLRGQGTPIL